MGQLSIGHRSYGTITMRGEGNSVTVGKYCSLAQGIVAVLLMSENIDEFISLYK